MTRPFPLTRVSAVSARACRALVGALLILLAVPAAPGAAPGRSAPLARAAASMPGPGYLDTGFSDIYAFQESPPAQGEAWFAIAIRAKGNTWWGWNSRMGRGGVSLRRSRLSL